MHKYIKLAPNFHILLNPAERFRTEVTLSFSSGGAFYENEDQKGLTHLLEHCEIKRTKELSKKDLNKLLFEKDLYLNASTGILMKDMVMTGHRDYAFEMVDLILQFGFRPEISQDILDAEKAIVLRELAQRKGDPGYKLTRLISGSVYKNGSKDLVEVTGNEEIVAKASIEDLYKVHQRVLKDSHFILTVVGGNIDEEKIIAMASDYSKSLPSDSTHPIDKNADNFLQEFKYKPIVSDLAHEHCVLSLMIPLSSHYGNRALRDIISEVLFYYPEGVLYKTLRDDLGLVYSVDYTFDESLQTLRIMLVGEIGNTQRLIEESLKILNSPEEYLNKEKVNLIKNLYIKRQQIASDNPYNPVNFMIETMLNYGVEQRYEEYLEEIKALSYESIMEYANELKKGIPEMKIVVVSRDKSIEKLKLVY